MKNLILTMVLAMGFAFGLNANTTEANDDCASFASLVYDGSLLRGMSNEASFQLAAEVYDDCMANGFN